MTNSDLTIPSSQLSCFLKVVKMLTEAQVVPMTSIDVLAHPAILGYTVSKTQKRRTPHLYVNGSCEVARSAAVFCVYNLDLLNGSTAQ